MPKTTRARLPSQVLSYGPAAEVTHPTEQTGGMQRAELEAELERLHREIFAWALVCCRGDRSEAEDVTQVSYLKVLDGRARFGGRSSFKTWIFGVVRRTAVERRRRLGVRAALLRRWVGTLVEPARSIAGEAELSEEGEQLARALGRLPLRQRQLLMLVFYHDLSIREASAALNISLGSARTHYERGKQRLRQRLGSEKRR